MHSFLSIQSILNRLQAQVPGRRILCVAALLATLGHGAWAHADHQHAPLTDHDSEARQLTWSLSQETWALPQGERMGMLGGRVLMDLMPHLQVGAASYGAVRGERGGFITLGGEAQTRWTVHGNTDALAGLFVGAGGGRGGRELTGGGLMLRAHLGLEQRLGAGHRIGLGVSRVEFPDGRIRSTQPYLAYAYDLDSHLYSGWPSQPGPRYSDSPWLSEQEFALTARQNHFAKGVVRDDGISPQYPRLQLLGAQWTGYFSPQHYLTLEAEGAMGGQNSGYMQILVGAGQRWAISPRHALKLQASLGPAGGGGADTGGGVITDVRAVWQWRVLPQQSIEWSVADTRAPSRSFQAVSWGINWVHHLQRPNGADVLAHPDMERLRMRLAQQTYRGRTPQWRCCYPDMPVDNLGLQLDYMLSPASAAQQWFVTGQGVAAYKGQAGAYMTGLVGAGMHQVLSQRWFWEAEGLLGAAGGGGLRTGGGLVGQLNASLGYWLSPRLALQASVGRMQAAKDSFNADVLGLGLVYRFSAVKGSAR